VEPLSRTPPVGIATNIRIFERKMRFSNMVIFNLALLVLSSGTL
jgi:hypothetical protein